MNLCVPLPRLGVVFLPVGLAFLSALLSQAAYAREPQEEQNYRGQQHAALPAQQNPPPPTPVPNADPTAPSVALPEQLPLKRRKVWTNDEVVELRTPADNYQAEKEARQAAEVEKAAKNAELKKRVKDTGLTMKLPATPEETQLLIKGKEEQIRDIQDGLNRLSHDLPDAPEEQKVKIQTQIEALTGDSEKAQLELKLLQDRLRGLAKPAPVETSGAPAAPSNPPPALPDPK